MLQGDCYTTVSITKAVRTDIWVGAWQRIRFLCNLRYVSVLSQYQDNFVEITETSLVNAVLSPYQVIFLTIVIGGLRTTSYIMTRY